jgi:uncharacterized membrane protein
MNRPDDTRGSTDVVRSLSGIALVGGLLVSMALLTVFGEIIVLFVLAGVLPTVLGYAGLARTGALPWQSGPDTDEAGDDEDLVEELKRRYARGELDDAELERKVETLLSADEDPGYGSTRTREYEFETGRR